MKTRRAWWLAALLWPAPGQAEPWFAVETDRSGCELHRLTEAPVQEFQHHGVSPDGKTLVVGTSDERVDPPGRGAYRLDLATGKRRPLPAVFDNAASFSPGGDALIGAFHGAPGSRTEIVRHLLASGETTTIAPHPGWDFLPVYSPDRRWVVFNSDRYGNGADIVRWDTVHRNLERLTADPRYEAHAQVAPDGQAIVFHRQLGRNPDGRFDFEIVILDLASGAQSALKTGAHEDSYPAWSPDGEHLVIASDRAQDPGRHDLYVIDRSGNVVTRLTDSLASDTYPSWTAQPEFVYFVSDRAGQKDVYRIPMQGTRCRAARDADHSKTRMGGN